MTIVVDPTTPKANTHHIKLSQGADELGLILCGPDGSKDIRSIDRVPYPRSALKFATGENKYSDLEPPFEATVMDDWSGGRGKKYWDDDKTRFADSYRMDTTRPGQVFPAGLEHFADTDRNLINYDRQNQYSYSYGSMGVTYYAQPFTPTANATIPYALVPLRTVGDPGTITAYIYDDDSGSPGSALYSEATSFTESEFKNQVIAFNPNISLTAGTPYWFVIKQATYSATDYYELLRTASGFVPTGKTSTDGLAWTAGQRGPAFVLTTHDKKFRKIFEYRKALYVYCGSLPYYDAGGTYNIYLLGDRGAAESNSANKTKLNDATKSWVTDEWKGCVALISAGPGEGEYLKISSNTGTVLTLDGTWVNTHTTATEYVILGSNKLTLVGSTVYPVTDIAVANDWVYLARGESYSILRWRAYNNGGTWVGYDTDTESYGAQYLKAIYDPTYGAVLYGAENRNLSYGVHMWKANVPKEWGDLLRSLGYLVDNRKPWDGMYNANITQQLIGEVLRFTIGSSFTTGFAAIRNLDSPVDITGGTALRFIIKSSVATSAGDLKLVIHDEEDCGQLYKGVDALYFFDGTTYTAMTKAQQPDGVGVDAVSLTSTAGIYVGSDEPFNKISVVVGATVNANAATMGVAYLGGAVVSSMTDGTLVAGKTLAQTGIISYELPTDWRPSYVNGIYKYWIRLLPSAALTASVTIGAIRVVRDQYTALSIPALAANTETWVNLALTINANAIPLPNDREIISIGLYVSTDLGAQQVDMYSPIYIAHQSQERIEMPDDTYITGLEGYAGGDEQQENCWVFTENKVYEIQNIEGADLAVPLALKEMEGLRNARNGVAHTVNGVYLYFNLDGRIERYYNRQLEDIGLDRDEGLPWDRTGTVVKLLSIPGKVIAGVTPTSVGSRMFSIYEYSGNGWHEIYRHFWTDKPLFDLFYQPIPGSDVGELWVAADGVLFSLHKLISTTSTFDYKVCPYGHLETPRIHLGLMDVDKFYKSIKVAMVRYKQQGYGIINIDYKTDIVTTWTEVTDSFYTDSVDENNISASYNVYGKWIKFRIRFSLNGSLIVATSGEPAGPVPELNALILESLSRIPVKYSYTINFRIKDRGVDLLENETADTVTSVLAQIDEWVASPLPVRMYAWSTPYNDKWVFVEPSGLKLLGRVEDEDGKESLIGQMTLIEI